MRKQLIVIGRGRPGRIGLTGRPGLLLSPGRPASPIRPGRPRPIFMKQPCQNCHS